MEILLESDLQVWSEESLKSFVEKENALFRVIVEDGKCLGFLLSQFIVDEVEILILAVALRFRRRGLGQKLLEDTVREASRLGISKCFLEVRDDNEAAVTLYRRNGFHLESIRRGYYQQQNRDALIMSLNLREFESN